MQFINVILALATATAISAVDVRLHEQSGCNGGSWQCLNLTPNRCCHANGRKLPSVGFYGIQWGNFETRAYGARGADWCGELRQLEHVGPDFQCSQNGPFTGAGYGFYSKKMIRGVGVPSSKCTSWERANVLLLEDGTKYSLEGVDDDQYAEFSESVANATVKEDVPEEFKQFEAEE